MSPTPRGQTVGQNIPLCPALRNRKSPWGKEPNVKTLSFPQHREDTRKVIALHFSLAIPHQSPWVAVGQLLQMTSALRSKSKTLTNKMLNFSILHGEHTDLMTELNPTVPSCVLEQDPDKVTLNSAIIF